MTAVSLARLEFALTAGFHFMFVSLTLGLAPLLAYLQTRYVAGGRAVYRDMTRFWGQLYVINYGMGIITGLVMEFQFGLDWNGLSRFAGNVFGAPLALETLIAFFLESTFLGMWIFGWDRLPKYAHLALIYLVTLTAFASAFWIMVANGFLQHPVGGVVRHGTFYLTDLTALVTNDEALVALSHLLGATFLTGALFVAGVSGWHLARDTGHRDFFTRSLRVGVVVAPAASALTINRGYAQFDYLKPDQPAKLALSFGKPVPRGLPLPPSWLGVPANIMQYAGLLLGALSVLALVLLLAHRGRTTGLRWLFRPLAWTIPLPFVLVVCGWVVREEGRQPWVVYGLLRTRDAVSPVHLSSVISSFTVFVGIFAALAIVDYRLMRRTARRGPGAAGLLGVPGGEVTAPVAVSL